MHHVLYGVEAGIATITLNRPESMNAFTDQMEAGIIAALDQADADDAVRVVVITGAGRAFCAGMDLAEADPDKTFLAWRSSETAPEGTQYQMPGEQVPLRRDGGGRVVLRMFALNKPIIAAINGHAVGVGATMTLAADIRIGADHAKLGFVFNQRGLVPESCSSWFLPRLVPMQVALEWVLTGRLIPAAEAHEQGLLLRLLPADQVLAEAYAVARQIADSTAAVSTALTRQMLWRMMGAAHPMIAHEIETEALNARGMSADARDGIAAFLQKREPVFADTVTEQALAPLRRLPEFPYTPPTGARP